MKISDTVECICPVDVIHDLSILVKNFGEGNDYFKVLYHFDCHIIYPHHAYLRLLQGAGQRVPVRAAHCRA